jgi:LytS/YehU family sensor histidine kinase
MEEGKFEIGANILAFIVLGCLLVVCPIVLFGYPEMLGITRMMDKVADLQGTLLKFLIFFLLTILSSYVGDDDVVYKLIDRKPTGKEAIARIRFVMVKVIASIFGGAVLAAFIGLVVIRRLFSFSLSGNQGVLLAVFCIAITALSIGEAQNIVRLIQGRQYRPITDHFTVLKHNFRLWTRGRG